MHRVICLLTVGMLVCWSSVYTGFLDNLLSLTTSRTDSSDISKRVRSSDGWMDGAYGMSRRQVYRRTKRQDDARRAGTTCSMLALLAN